LLFILNTQVKTAVIAVIALWRGMKAQERMADSMEKIANATERIEKIVRRDEETRV